MKFFRSKKYRRILSFYRIHFGYYPPYRILVDPDFLRLALEKKVYFKESFPKIFQSKAYCVVTRCISADLRRRGESYKAAALVAKRLNHVKCSHLQEPVSAKDCILSLLESHEYCVAAGNEELKKKVVQVPGIPLLFIVNNMIVLDMPSNSSKNFAKKNESQRMEASEHEKKLAENAQKTLVSPEEIDGKLRVQNALAFVLRKRKRAKGPNPLSVKKKKRKTTSQQQETDKENITINESKKKRKRPRYKKKQKVDTLTVSDVTQINTCNNTNQTDTIQIQAS